MSIPPVAVPPRPATSPRGARLRAVAASVVLCGLSAFLVIAAAGAYGAQVSGATESTGFTQPWRSIAFAASFVMLGVCVLLGWRHRMPVLVAAVATAATLVLPTSPLPMLIALAAVTAATAGGLRVLFIGTAWLATTTSLLWNLQAPNSAYATIAGDPGLGSAERILLAWIAPLVAALFVLPFAAFGVSRRLRRERDTATAGTAAATRNVEALHREVERERDRQELARELHDTLAARLSAVSLHAGALELSVDESDEKAATAARLVREAAQGSLDDLRNVVHVLRNPAAAQSREGLGDIPTLVDRANESGADVRPQVYVTDAGRVEPEIAHAVYRLVQEAISNARRHADGAPLHIDLRGDADTGLSVRIRNERRPNAQPTSRGGGHGLSGLGERVALLGGSFQAGPTPDGAFTIVAWLPGVRPEGSLR